MCLVSDASKYNYGPTLNGLPAMVSWNSTQGQEFLSEYHENEVQEISKVSGEEEKGTWFSELVWMVKGQTDFLVGVCLGCQGMSFKN